MIVLFGVLLVLAACCLFYLWYPPFGGRTPKSTFLSSKNYHINKFSNTKTVSLSFKARDLVSMIRRQLQRQPSREPTKQLVAATTDIQAFLTEKGPQFIWFGHSTVLARFSGQTFLFDPIFSKRASPFQWIGPKRFDTTPRMHVEDLPQIDVIVISHDHYDHLDYKTIKQLRTKANHFFVPLGLKAHLRKWGIAEQNITELDWWQEAEHNGITFACTPAQHFSGRTLSDRAKTLWASWAVMSANHKLFFSGDGGYGPHFKQIGEKYGPFDMTLLECGQYDTLWAEIHMTPEQTVQAHIDLDGEYMLPIHWGAFKLALHSWTDPIERALAAATKTKSTILAPRLGELISIPTKQQTSHWFDKPYN